MAYVLILVIPIYVIALIPLVMGRAPQKPLLMVQVQISFQELGDVPKSFTRQVWHTGFFGWKAYWKNQHSVLMVWPLKYLSEKAHWRRGVC